MGNTGVIVAPEFKASSGRTLRQGEDGTITFKGTHGYLNPGAAMDVEEFFEAKKDAELGRWRDPFEPRFTVYETEIIDVVKVLDEAACTVTHVHRRDAGSGAAWTIGARYFEAHPERKPWQDASQGQVWELDVVGVSNWVAVEAGDSEEPRAVFLDPHTMVQIEVDDPAIASGRRIWPEDAS